MKTCNTILKEKRQPGEMKLEEVKKIQNVFKSNLNEISKGRFKSEEQEMTKNIKLLYESREAVIKLLSDYTNSFSPNDYAKNDKIILKYFQ